MRKSRLEMVRKSLLTIVLVLVAGYLGFLIGEQRLKVSFKNWKQPVTFNRQEILSQAKQRQGDFTLFWTAWDKVNDEYVDKTALDPDKMIQGAIGGMVASLGDPYTVYLPPQQNKESKEDLGGAFEGVGIQLGFKDKQLAVVSPLDGSPAFKAGVKSGDLIVRIKDTKKNVDQSTAGLSLPEAVNIIRGTKGTTVELTLIREGADEPIDVKLVRDTIVVKSVTLEFKESNGKKIAWLKLNRFGDRTQDEWTDAVSQIGDAPVVLDVRNNPGGYLEGAVYLAGEFLSPGKLVVTQQYGDGSKIEHKVARNGRLLKNKVVILANGGSASAAEILAGALQDHNRAKVVGVKTFGKGSVQQPEDFPDGSGIHVTVAKWLLPSGNWVDKNGITPDITVEPDKNATDETKDVQLEKAIESL